MKGDAGDDGADGMGGLSALAVTSTEPAGSNCADGGLKIEVGVDDNYNGLLEASEVDQTQYVCDGADGANGTAGVNGTNGSASPNTMLTSISAPTLQACSSGGRIVQQGLDNGDGGGTAQNGVLESGEVDYTTTYCSNFVLTRMADIDNGSGNGYPGKNAGLTVVGTTIYFNAYTNSSGYELWAHEMTNSSTWQVADINSGGHSNPGQNAGLTVMGTRLYFDASAGSNNELWAHETTNSSTWLVADINSGGSSNPGIDAGLTVMGTRLYFDAFTGSDGRELWAHETTNSSTWLVADINSGAGNGYPGQYAGLTVVGTRLYFDADDGSSGYELWAHETTNSSTWQVADIDNGAGSGDPGGYAGLTVVDTRLYFDANDGSSGYELWAHETTNSSTWQVADINSGGHSNPGFFGGTAVVGTTLYFDAYTISSGRELWAHETANSSTWQVADIDNGAGSGDPGVFAGLTVMGTRLYFDAYTSSSGVELWAHETTNSSTWQVADIRTDSGSGGNPGRFAGLTVMGTRLYFDAYTSSSGRELWVHETANSSTWQVSDGSYSNPGRYAGLTVVGTRLYFDAYTSSSGYELWRMEIEHSITYN
jgi:ELWxxDGT repeat protein